MDALLTARESSGARPKAVVRAARAADRVDAALAWLVRLPPGAPAVVVAPTVEAAAEMVRRAVPTCGARFGWHRLTLGRLAGALAARGLLRADRVAVGPLTTRAIAARVVHRLGPRALGRLGRVADRPGLPLALARTLSELREARLGAAEVTEPEIATVLAAYEQELASARLADRADVLLAAIAAARDGGGLHDLLGPALLLLDVPVATALEADLVGAVAGRACSVLATVPAGDDRTAARLADTVAPPEDVGGRPASSLGRLQEGLFAASAEEAARTDDVMVFSAPGENRESVEIARAVQREAERGVRFDRMAVALRSSAQYRAHLEEALRRAEIPAYFAHGTPRPDPAGRAMSLLLACAAEGLSAARFAEYLSLGEAAVPGESGDLPPVPPSVERYQPPDVDVAFPFVPPEMDTEPSVRSDPAKFRVWEGLLVAAAVIGGKDRWARRLDKLARDPSQDQEALSALRGFALPLVSALEPLGALRGTWQDWLDRLSLLATRALRAPDRVLTVLAELAPLAPVGPVDLGEVRIVLEPRLTELAQPPCGRRFGKLFVGSVDDIRGLAFDVVFIPGMAERIFPQKVTEDPILPDRDRARYGDRLATNADRAHLERLALRIAVGAACSRVVISYPRVDTEQSRPRTPSFYALEILRAAEGKLPGWDELSRRAEQVGGARLGWPAPARPADAIDAAEHDLALLEAILDKSERETVGTARYLLDANPHLARALRFRARRWITTWTRADGLVDPGPEAAEALAVHALSHRSFSPTALQHYASCPYRFVLYAIHKLAAREEPAPLEELDPLTRGSLIHEVQYELLSEMRSEGLLPVTPEGLDTARRRLDVVLECVAARYEEELAPAIDRVWRDGIDAVRVDLREWLRRASEESEWTPAHFELSFGLDPHRERDPRSNDDPVTLDCGLVLRGSIDLVERSRRGTLRATDHKSGKPRAAEGTVIGGGETLQPVLYALALEKLFPGEGVEAGRLYYCTAAADFASVNIPLDDRAREAAALVAHTVQEAIEQGFLPAAPAPRTCSFCDYLCVCGPYEELRAGKIKRQDALRPLERLRRRA